MQSKIVRWLQALINRVLPEIALFTSECVAALKADTSRINENLLTSSAVSTALLPKLGYERTAQIVRQAREAGVIFSEQIIAEGILSAEEMDAILGVRFGQSVLVTNLEARFRRLPFVGMPRRIYGVRRGVWRSCETA